MGIKTALTECLDVVVVSNDHRDRNGKESDDKWEGEEAAIPSLMQEGRTGVRRAREEKCRGGEAVAAAADDKDEIQIMDPSV